MENKQLVQYSVEDGVATVILDNPERRNALSKAMLEALHEVFDTLATAPDAKVIVLAANGPVFCSGHDLRELSNGSREEYDEIFSICSKLMEKIRRQPQPVIARVHALATAAGCQLVASCDLAVASTNAAFATPGVKIGLFCTTPAVAICRTIAPKKAMHMLLTGSTVPAEEAERIGLVNTVVSPEKLNEETQRLAAQIASTSAATVQLGKHAFYHQLPLDYPEAYDYAQAVMVENALSDDAKEGISAFLQKRQPVWKESRVMAPNQS